MTRRARAWTLAGLASSYGVVSCLVYADAPGRVRLTGEALRGAEVWHAQNCQACHQVYGYGGFLGPDLTNFASRQPGGEVVVRVMLREGPGAMPAFALGLDDERAVWRYLEALDRTGVGQARALSWWAYE